MATLADSAAVRDAVAEYLRAAGMPEVAAALSPLSSASPLTSAGPFGSLTSAAPLAPLTSAAPLASATSAAPLASPPALALLLNPHAAARAALARLLRSGDEALRQQFCFAPLPEKAAKLALLRALREAMWSAQCDADDTRLPAAQGADLFSVRAATLCQLVARLTHVCVLTLTSPGEAHECAQNRFIRAFLRQHRSFALSRALLARMLERFLVPQHSIAIGCEHFVAHGVTVHAPGTSVGPRSSTSLWLRMCHAVQVRVLSVLALWLRVHPRHFDSVMLETIGVFLDDCCYRPQAWADCPSQLTQIAENVRAEAVRAAIICKERHRTANHSDHPINARHYMGNAPVSDPSHESSHAVLSFFDTFSSGRVAAALTARDLCLMADVCEDELFDASRSTRIVSFVPDRGLLALLACGAELCAWAVSALLHAARSGLKAFTKIVQRLEDLSIKLLQLNNVHSAVAVIRALRHPLLERIMRNNAMVRAALPSTALQSIDHVTEVFDLSASSATARCKAHDAYVTGILDADLYPIVPALQCHVRELRYLYAEVPTFLRIPGGALGGTEASIAVHWQKFMLADDIIERVLTWQAAAAAANVSRDVEWEETFVQQVSHVVHDPRCLARMANELLSAL